MKLYYYLFIKSKIMSIINWEVYQKLQKDKKLKIHKKILTSEDYTLKSKMKFFVKKLLNKLYKNK